MNEGQDDADGAAAEKLCAYCDRPIQWEGRWWQHRGGRVACGPDQATYPPRGTNAAPHPKETRQDHKTY